MKLFLTACCIAVSFVVTAQNNKAIIDSIEKTIPSLRDSTLVKAYNELTWQYRLVDRDKAIEYGNKAITLGNKTKFLKGIAQAYNDLGIIFYDKENYDSAIHLYQLAAGIREKLKDELGIASLYNKIGIIYQRQGVFDKALENQFKALSLYEKNKNDYGISYSLNNIGIINQNMGQYDEAAKYQKQSIRIKEKINDVQGIAGSYINLANIYYIQEEYDTSEYYYLKAIDLLKTTNNKEYISNAQNNLGKQYQTLKQYDKAIPLINESLGLRKELGDTKGTVSCLNNLGNIYIEKKMTDTAESILLQALKLGKDAVNCQAEVNMVYQSLSKLYESTGKTDKALAMYKLYAESKDSLYTDELGDKFAKLETEYKTLEKEKTIQQQEFAIKQKNYWITGIAGLLVLGGLLSYSTYRRYKLKQQARLNAEILKQQELATKAVLEAEEAERQRIAKDLHDGVGQMMSAAKMNLSAYESEVQFTNPEQRNSFDKIIQLVDESCKEVRSVSHNMMPNALLKNSLASAVREFIDKLDQRTLQVHLYTEGLDERLDSNVETVLYRIIQECVNNVIKHSGASTLDISVVKDKDGISATVEDNGKGFDTTDKTKFDGIGLKNISTRVEYLKGTVDFDSTIGKGTLVAIHVPLN